MREMAKTFIDALTKLESTGESDLMERLFAEEAEIINPLTQQRGGGTETARRFWETYRQSFNSINSSFLM
jgi:hypothetical protein